MKLQQSGEVDIIGILENQGQDAAVEKIVSGMPGASVMTILFCILVFIFLATTIDSAAYVLASGSVRKLGIDEQPSRSYRVFWAGVLAVLSIALLAINQLTAVQTISLIAGLPMIFVQFYLFWAGWKLLKDRYYSEGVFRKNE